jgi:alkanesulfonate monooxygenase
MSPKRQIHLAFSIQGAGYHTSAWRLPSAPANPDTSIDFYIKLAQLAERGKFDMIFFADWLGLREDLNAPEGASRVPGIARLEPITALAAIASVTSRIGLTGTISTTFMEPFHVARIMGSLDHVSKGRAGWNVVTSWADADARQFGESVTLPDRHKRYERAQEFMKVVFALWDSWEDDAFVRNKETGIYFDPTKVYPLNHKGEFFAVEGPLTIERTPQGRPIISQAGASEEGQELAAATADMIFANSGKSMEDGRAFYDSVKARMPKYGRAPEELKIMPGIHPVVGTSEQDARDRYQMLQDLITPEQGLALLGPKLGDLRGLPVDKPVPNPPKPHPSFNSLTNRVLELACSGKTIRELYQFASGRNSAQPIGTPAEVADYLEERFTQGAADGFNCLFGYVPESAELFIEHVVPILQKRGLYRKDYEGTTLREHLGLAYPVNRHPSKLVKRAS